MLLALTRGTTRPSCSSTKVLKLGVTVLELALLHLREKVSQLDIFFPFRRKRVVVLPALVGFRLRGLGRILLANAANLRSSPLGIDRAPDGSSRRLKLRRRTRPAQRLRCSPGQV